MSEIFTIEQVQQHLRDEVAEAGGAKKWLRKNKVFGCDHILHRVQNGDAATLPRVMKVLKFRRVDRYEPFV